MNVKKLKLTETKKAFEQEIQTCENRFIKEEPIERMNNRLSQLKFIQKKSTNVICSWLVLCPNTLQGDTQKKKFFELIFKFLAERYGGLANVVSCSYTLNNPSHMLFRFVPVITDNGIEKLNARAVIDRTELLKIHREAEEYMFQATGTHGLIQPTEPLKDRKSQLEDEVKALEAKFNHFIEEADKFIPHKATELLVKPKIVRSKDKTPYVKKDDYDALMSLYEQANEERIALLNANQSLQAKINACTCDLSGNMVKTAIEVKRATESLKIGKKDIQYVHYLTRLAEFNDKTLLKLLDTFTENVRTALIDDLNRLFDKSL